jgi:1-acyl-sn-glycerol-3-phosphate acyltransferase
MEPGVALVVRKAGVPIVPAAIIGAFEAWPKGQKVFRNHPVRIAFGPPLNVKGMKGEQVTRLIEVAIRKLFDDLHAGRMNERVASEPWAVNLVPSPGGRGL